jgi:hypothetical protein
MDLIVIDATRNVTDAFIARRRHHHPSTPARPLRRHHGLSWAQGQTLRCKSLFSFSLTRIKKNEECRNGFIRENVEKIWQNGTYRLAMGIMSIALLSGLAAIFSTSRTCQRVANPFPQYLHQRHAS